MHTKSKIVTGMPVPGRDTSPGLAVVRLSPISVCKPQNELAKDGTLDATRFALRIAELVKDEDEDENNEEGAAWLR
eukprot:846244-Pelagomonas_calceolata.AAC.1